MKRTRRIRTGHLLRQSTSRPTVPLPDRLPHLQEDATLGDEQHRVRAHLARRALARAAQHPADCSCDYTPPRRGIARTCHTRARPARAQAQRRLARHRALGPRLHLEPQSCSTTSICLHAHKGWREDESRRKERARKGREAHLLEDIPKLITPTPVRKGLVACVVRVARLPHTQGRRAQCKDASPGQTAGQSAGDTVAVPVHLSNPKC